MKKGDILAISSLFGLRMRCIERITPTGRIVIGGQQLRPDLSVRGYADDCPKYFVPTPEQIRAYESEGNFIGA